MTTPAQEAMLVEVGSLFTELAAWARTAIRPDDHRFCAGFAAAYILDVLDSNNIQSQALVGKPAGDGPILIGVELAPLRWATWSRAEPGGGWRMEMIVALNGQSSTRRRL